MKYKGFQRTFAFLLTLLLTLSSAAGFGLQRGAKAEGALAFDAQPSNEKVYDGTPTTFTVAVKNASGTPPYTYAWEYKTTETNATWQSSTGTGHDTARLQVAAGTSVVAKSGYEFRCKVTDSASPTPATITSDPAELTVYSVNAIAVDGAGSVAKGGTETYSADVTGDNNPPDGEVAWSVDGGASGTTIHASTGVLTVAADETASSLTVKATSTKKGAIVGTKNVNVTPQLTGITIATGPNNQAYKTGDTFDPAGMVVNANYGDGSSSAITDYTYSPNGALALSNNAVTISYTKNGVTKTASQTISVTNEAVTSISMTSAATVAVNGTVTLAGTVAPGNATNQTIVWSLNPTGTTATGSSVSGGVLTAGATTGDVKVTATIDGGKADGSAYTEDFTVQVTDAPSTAAITISGQPASQVVTAGSISGSLTCTAQVLPAGPTLDYQWYSCTNESKAGEQAIGSETNSAFAIPTSLATGTYYYFCRLSASGAGTVDSNVATITVNAAATSGTITIGTQPIDTTVKAGAIAGSLTCAATASNGATPTYQWYSNTSKSTAGGTSIPGAATASFTIPTTLTNAASPYYYYCEVSAAGATPVKSSVATVTVSASNSTVTGVTITPATSLAMHRTERQNFTATVVGTNAPEQTVVWTLSGNGSVPAGEDPNAFISSRLDHNTVFGDHNRYYGSNQVPLVIGGDEPNGTVTLRATSQQDPTKYVDVMITVSGPIVKTGATPANVSTEQGRNATLTCNATVDPAGTVPTYQWYTYDGASTYSEISRATSSSYTVQTASLTPGTYYYQCEVKAGNTIHNSRTVAVTVTAPATPVITINAQPADRAVREGAITGALTCNATVSTGITPTYQWYSNTSKSTTGGTPVSGATAASFTIPTTLTNAASPYYYYCTVSAVGATPVNSSVATVTVSPSNSTVTGVTINPASASVARGANQSFTALVNGTNSPSQAVDWVIVYNIGSPVSNDTRLVTLPGGGVQLTVGMDEPNASFIIRATSQQDNTKKAEATVTVIGAYIVINSTTPADTTVVKGTNPTLTCTASVTPSGTTPFYQWYSFNGSNWTSISGANTSSYVVQTAGMATGSYQYRCTVTAGTTVLTSRAATVRVNDAASYVVTKGDKGVFTRGGTGTLGFTVNAEYNTFNSVVVDNVTLTRGTHYQVASGSTIVTLANSYLNTLSVGTHTMYVYFNIPGGTAYAVATFTVGGQPYVWNLYPEITSGNHVETTWLGKGEKMRLTLYVNNPTNTYVTWHYSSKRIGLSSTSTQLYYDANTGYYVTWIDVTPRYNGSVWVYAENSGKTTNKHSFTVVGMNNLPATGQDDRPIRILIGLGVLTAAALGAMYVWKRKKAL